MSDATDAPSPILVGVGPDDASLSDARGSTADAAGADGSTPVDAAADAHVPMCDAGGDPRFEQSQGCGIDTTLAVFVGSAPSGASDASLADAGSPDGSMARPYPTITAALAHLNGKSRIVVCDGTYSENVAMTAAANASLYGGFACTNGWTWDGGVTKVAAPAGAPALSLDGVVNAQSLVIEDMSFASADASAHDASGNGNSSITALVAGSNVAFTRVTLAAGAGADGSPGINGSTIAAVTALSNYTGGTTAPPGTEDSVSPVNNCSYMDSLYPPHDSSTGGAGSTFTVKLAGAGSSNPPVPPSDMTSGHDGQPGYNGVAGDPGADGQPRGQPSPAIAFGTVNTSPAGWTPSPGRAGPAGQPAQGGGGGGYYYVGTTFNPGGSGGAGGCGGAGGGGGGGGGASIAMLSVNASVSFTACSLSTAAGGKGGPGGTGQPGQLGGAGFTPPIGVSGYPSAGAAGGNGAGGSGGAGGSAGISAGIVYLGTAPQVDTGPGATKFSLPLAASRGAGQGGQGGQGGSAANGGSNGVSGYTSSAAVSSVLAPPWM